MATVPVGKLLFDECNRIVFVDITSDNNAEEKLKTPMGIPAATTAPEDPALSHCRVLIWVGGVQETVENALRAWCRAIFGLASWPGLEKFKTDVQSYAEVSAECSKVEAEVAEVEAAVVRLDMEIKANSDM